MNLHIIFGFLGAIGVFVYSINEGIRNPAVFLSSHAAMVVFGGTICVALICFPTHVLLGMARSFLGSITGQTRIAQEQLILELARLSEALNTKGNLAEDIVRIRNVFLRECVELLENGGLTKSELEDVLRRRVQSQIERYRISGATFRVLGKFPPAFGLIGTTMGMIALLQGLGEPDSFQNIGPSMSLALVATFYGLILANLFIIPLGESISQTSDEDIVTRRIAIEGVMLLREKKHPLIVQEYLRSYLTPKQRNLLKRKQAA